MFSTFCAAIATVLTLALPSLPQGLTLLVTTYLGLVVLAGFGGFLRSGAARAQLTLLLPWLVALILGLIVGAFRGNHPIQLMEDALPYLLFALGLCAGRAASNPRALLAAALLVAVVDGVISLVLMESWDLSTQRSVYNHFKLVVGHPLVGLFCASFLLHFVRARLLRRICAFSRLFLIVVVIATVSRGMVLAMTLGWLTSVSVRSPRRGALVALGAGLVVLAFAAVLSDLGVQYLRLGNVGTVDGRVLEIRECLRIFTGVPILGAGLGAELVVHGHYASYVHNILAYHLWKFGLVGSALFALPIVSLARQTLRAPLHLRATMLAGAVSVLVYVVTSAAYKSYILVSMTGFVVGAALQLALPRRVAPASPVPEAK